MIKNYSTDSFSRKDDKNDRKETYSGIYDVWYKNNSNMDTGRTCKEPDKT